VPRRTLSLIQQREMLRQSDGTLYCAAKSHVRKQLRSCSCNSCGARAPVHDTEWQLVRHWTVCQKHLFVATVHVMCAWPA